MARQQKRKIDPTARSTALSAPKALGRLTGRVLERLEGGLGTLLGGSLPLLVRQGRPEIDLGAAFGRPRAVPSASRRVPESAAGAQNDPRSIFRQFLVDLGRIFVNI